jgi:hypothetical protein
MIPAPPTARRTTGSEPRRHLAQDARDVAFHHRAVGRHEAVESSPASVSSSSRTARRSVSTRWRTGNGSFGSGPVKPTTRMRKPAAPVPCGELVTRSPVKSVRSATRASSFVLKPSTVKTRRPSSFGKAEMGRQGKRPDSEAVATSGTQAVTPSRSMKAGTSRVWKALGTSRCAGRPSAFKASRVASGTGTALKNTSSPEGRRTTLMRRVAPGRPGTSSSTVHTAGPRCVRGPGRKTVHGRGGLMAPPCHRGRRCPPRRGPRFFVP